MCEFSYDREEIIDLIANFLTAGDKEITDLERQAVVAEVEDECDTPEKLAAKYNETYPDTEVCEVEDEESWTFVFKTKE